MIRFFKLCSLLIAISVAAAAQNYDEAKVPAYVLPDPLVTALQKRISSQVEWENSRRTELLTLFADHVYGAIRNDYDSLSIRPVLVNEHAMNGRAKLKIVEVAVFKSGKSVRLELVLFIPKHVAAPPPVFLLLNNRDKNNTDPTRVVKSGFWPAEMLIDSGYAVAAFQVSDAAPDNKDTYHTGVLQLYPQMLIQPNGMKAIGAWAWAARRIMDYFERDAEVNAKKVCIVGHSRGGKAALWAGAQDQRFAMVVSNCSGNTGAALARRKFGETIRRINEQFPHWFCENYKKYNDNEQAVPVDQHMLLSLVAPRLLYVTSASKDLWADPTGTYLSLKNAAPVYALYGIKSTLPEKLPSPGSALHQSRMGYHNREGEHNLTAWDWRNFVVFAGIHLKGVDRNKTDRQQKLTRTLYE
ncbi:acetylxylan esterase [Segetibacter sp. 3557_3]|uniref:dienelactone hydrolase family protein n=1 Tax=Segetibacter sp. 3557_3 TaxID=2547429 RepID=UPI0010583E30|nr:prolyl oligopeptidase family serine peptidase [Segetibacter sp. 3557_3]TDH28976.1 acetylxylan esterase [Segetibacter sp. 3557_3]